MKKEKNLKNSGEAKEKPKDDFKIVFNNENSEVMFLLTVDGVMNYATIKYKSQALSMAEFLLDSMDKMEDDIGAGFHRH